MKSQFLLREDDIFFNHGSYGACPHAVFTAYQQWQRELEKQPVEFLGRRFLGLMREARKVLGEYLHADPNDLVYVPNATTGMNMVARSIPLEAGDEILSTDHEYGAIDRLWRYLAKRHDAKYIRRPVPTGLHHASDVIETVWSGVTERTKVLTMSHITSPTALVFPIAELVARARDAGILTVIDGAHAPGQIDLDLDALGADAYTGNCHKWMLAPKGAGFLHVEKSFQKSIDPLIVSWGWEADAPTDSQFIDENEYHGTRDIAAYLSVPTAIAFMREHNWTTQRAACHQYALNARRRFEDLFQTETLCALDDVASDNDSHEPSQPQHRWIAQMCAQLLPKDVNGAELQRHLFDGYRIEIPVTRWNDRELLRLSAQAYNTPEELDALCRALKALL